MGVHWHGLRAVMVYKRWTMVRMRPAGPGPRYLIATWGTWLLTRPGIEAGDAFDTFGIGLMQGSFRSLQCHEPSGKIAMVAAGTWSALRFQRRFGGPACRPFRLALLTATKSSAGAFACCVLII